MRSAWSLTVHEAGSVAAASASANAVSSLEARTAVSSVLGSDGTVMGAGSK